MGEHLEKTMGGGIMTVSKDDILAAIAAERNKQLASSIDPFTPELTHAEIIANHKKLTQPGRGGQKIGADARLGSPKSAVTGTENLTAANAFNIPGLKEAMAAERARNKGEYVP